MILPHIIPLKQIACFISYPLWIKNLLVVTFWSTWILFLEVNIITTNHEIIMVICLTNNFLKAIYVSCPIMCANTIDSLITGFGLITLIFKNNWSHIWPLVQERNEVQNLITRSTTFHFDFQKFWLHLDH